MSLGPSEVIVVLVVALIVLGPDKLPQAARGLARFYKQARDVSNSFRSQIESALEIDDSPKIPDAPNPPNPDLDGFTLVDKNDKPPTES